MLLDCSPPAAKTMWLCVPLPPVANTRFPSPVVPTGASMNIYPSFPPVIVKSGSENAGAVIPILIYPAESDPFEEYKITSVDEFGASVVFLTATCA